jgi:transaldolase/glucose-6-phosphate isomerase
VGRENLMIKVPGTPEGITAIRQLIGEGINVNVTLLFARETYEQAAEAYLDGLETFAVRGGDLAKVTSVASFFISRIDTAADQYIGERLKYSQNPGENAMLRSLLGKVAVASANSTYQKYLQIHREDRWRELKKKGAHSQRLLWASTGSKNPKYSDVLYVEELIGHDTVNTMPPATLDAFREHGRVRPALIEDVQESIRILDMVKQAGIPLKELTDKLLVEGVRQFADAFDKLLKAIEHSSNAAGHDPITFLRIKLLKELDKERRCL